jgi:uncharacterized protein
MNVIRKNPVAFFILFSLVITYVMGLGIYFVLASELGVESLVNELVLKFGPAIAGIIIIFIVSGREGLKNLFLRCIQWRVSIWWYLFALLFPLAVCAGVLYFTGYQQAVKSLNIYSMIGVFCSQLFLAVFLGGGLGEEPGWRGFMLPRLLERYSVLSSGILVGIAWFAWHIPAYIFFNKGADDPVIPFFIICISFSLILARVFFYTNKSLVIPIILHGSMNAVFYSMEELMPDVLNSPEFQPAFDWTVSLIWLAAALVMQLKFKVTKN